MAQLMVNQVNVTIPIFEVSKRSLRKTLSRIGQRSHLADADEGVVNIEALRDISFSLEHGDRLGLIGQNGAGKSTLLRVLAGIYWPQSGQVVRQGKVVPLLEITLGLDDNSTGRQNIRLRALFLGMTPAEIGAREEEIIAFAQLAEYIDMPVRAYSSGMRMRLAFSISMAVDAEILLLDEVVGVGDSAFQAKAKARLQDVSARSGIVVMALHSSPTIMELCNKALWLKDGKMRMFGECHEVVRAYDDFMHGHG